MKILNTSYSIWKQVVQNNNFSVYFLSDGSNKGHCWAGTNELIYYTRMVDDSWTDFDTTFPSGIRIVVGRTDDAIAQITGLSNIPSTHRTSKHYNKIQIEPPEHNRVDTVSLNWCDKTTWYTSATKLVDETFINSGDNLIFAAPVSGVMIDVSHGRLTGEYNLRTEYAPVIKIDNILQTESSPNTVDGDFQIDYHTQNITFNTIVSGIVTATYYQENGSEWIIKPSSGKILRLTEVEVQFSKDIELKDTVKFQAYGFVDAFAPQLTPSPYPSGTLIPLGPPTIYQTMQDYINEASYAYPDVPQLGGPLTGLNSWRVMKTPEHIFRWPYSERGTTDLYSSKGMEIRITLEKNIEFGGNIAISTFYGTSENE